MCFRIFDLNVNSELFYAINQFSVSLIRVMLILKYPEGKTLQKGPQNALKSA